MSGSQDADLPSGVGPVPAGYLQLLAGQPGGSGWLDGLGSSARFSSPTGIASDASGTIYVADTFSNLIRKIDSSGTVSTLAGSAGVAGSADGVGTAASFSGPTGVAVDSSGNVFVTDRGNLTIRKITPSGTVTTFAGTAGSNGTSDGTGAAARFTSPWGIAIDASDVLYVSDSEGIRKISPTAVVTTLAGSVSTSGSTDGMGAAARFFTPKGLTVNAAGTVFVADSGNATIRQVTAGGAVTTLAGSAGNPNYVDGTGSAARFGVPTDVVVDGAGNLFVVDSVYSLIRKIDAGAVVTSFAGTAGSFGATDGTGSSARFNQILGIGKDSAGNFYVSDNASMIRKITPAAVVTTLAGAPAHPGSVDAIAGSASFNSPSGLAADSAGNVYVSDLGNGIIRKISANGTVTTLAGTAGLSGTSDGTGAAARFFGPQGVAVDANGIVYVADYGASTIREITPSGVVTTLAGSPGLTGTADGTGSAARFTLPQSVAVDSAGNVYVTDKFGTSVRKVTAAGVVTTLAGGAGSGSADGTGAAAHFAWLTGIAVDSSGIVYVADYTNSNIRRITPAGVVTTLAGLAGSAGSADGVGTAARFNGPHAITVDESGSLYVTDTGNSTVRKILANGTVTTVVGVAMQKGVGVGALPGTLNPYALALGANLLYIGGENAVVECQAP